MITNAAIASKSGPDSPKPSLKSSRDCGADGPEMKPKTSEEPRPDEHVTISADARALAARACVKDGTVAKDGKAGNGAVGADGADVADADAAAEESDPKTKQLQELREWAKQVEREVRLQQHKILEQLLKQPGRDGGKDGNPFLVVTPDGVCVKPPDGGCARPGGAEKAEAAQVPEYWNAENTSDRIVHFATQMAEISGMDLKEFGEIIKQAVSKGFDQAGAATGELTGAAAKLNQDTKDLVFSKLSKWLEEHGDMPYNQGARNPAAAGALHSAGSIAESASARTGGPG